jgi:hypothetical protein
VSCGDAVADREEPDACEASCGDSVADATGPDACVPQCLFEGVPVECGDDGCGGSCGECPGEQDECMDGTCVCQPDCKGKTCGEDGCGGSCAEPVPAGCNDGLPPEECGALGGYSWYMGCPDDGPCVCGCPTGDAGCPCTSGADCQGVCVTLPPGVYQGMPDDLYCSIQGPEGICSTYHVLLGCMCILTDEGKPHGSCWD